MQQIPRKIQDAEHILRQIEGMVQAMHCHDAYTIDHISWAERVGLAWARSDGRTDAAALVVEGPLDQWADGTTDEDRYRQRTLARALLEAAIFEVTESSAVGGAAAATCALDGLPEVNKIQAALRDWLKLGAWRENEKSPLTEIGRMIERTSGGPDDSVATRLGLLVPFWSSLALWQLLSDRKIAASGSSLKDEAA